MIRTLRYKTNIRGIIYHEDTTVLNLYAPNTASKFIKEK